MIKIAVPQLVQIAQQPGDLVTHSIGFSNPGVFSFKSVNLRMKVYTNKDSHLPDGCIAPDGGQTCPLRSGLTPGAAIAKKKRLE